SPRRGVNELAQTRSRRRRVLRLRVPARLARNNVIKRVPPSAALNRPTLSFSPFLTTPAPGPGSDNILNVTDRALNKVRDLTGIRLNPLDRCFNHFLSTSANKLPETTIADTLFDLVKKFLERVKERENTSPAARSVSKVAHIGTIAGVNVHVVVVAGCSPNYANTRE